jgi:CRP/FNR family transcriptional regulator, nitrogen oxide reductase regulator
MTFVMTGDRIRSVPIDVPIPFDSIPLLAALRKEDRELLAPLCRMRGYEKGEVIFHEGDPADRIHFVHVGRVKIVKSAGGRDVILEILGPGEPVGAVAVFERRPFPASAIAIEPSGLLSIPEREFFALLENRPEMMRLVLAGLTYRLMMVNKRLADMTGSAEYRAARLFLTLADRVGLPKGESVVIPLTLSRQEIADLIGTTLETAIRLMSRWQKEELVLTEKTGFVIPRVTALRDMSSE